MDRSLSVDRGNYIQVPSDEVEMLLEKELPNPSDTRLVKRRTRFTCCFCVMMILLILIFTSRFRPGTVFYNEKDILKKIPPELECLVIVPVTGSRTIFKNTLHHLELTLTLPCMVLVSEDAAWWDASNELVLDYVNRNQNWLYAKHASPILGIPRTIFKWIQYFVRGYLSFIPALEELVIVPDNNSYTVHFYDIFHLCFDRLNLPDSSMVMMIEDDIMVRHDAVQFGRWVTNHYLTGDSKFWSLFLTNLDGGGQAVYKTGERVREDDNYDVVIHHKWSTWGYAITRTQWDKWWHTGFSWWVSFDSVLRKTMDFHNIPSLMSGLVRARHEGTSGVHTLNGCQRHANVDIHVEPLVLNYTDLNFAPRIRKFSDAGPAFKKTC